MEVHFRECKHSLRQRIEIDYQAIATISFILRRYRQRDRNFAVQRELSLLLAHLYGPVVRCKSDMTAWR